MPKGTAVLVHGGWSSPDDWTWVADVLRRHDVAVVAPDLPSHHEESAHRGDDVDVVNDVLKMAVPPIVVAGWSYGGQVVSELPSTAGIERLVFVAYVPRPIAAQPGDEAPTVRPDLSHVVFPDEQMCVIDNEWFLTEGDGALFPAEVVSHLRRHPRRPCTIAAFLAPPHGEAWRTVPTTVLLGRSDDLVPAPMQEWASSHFDDVRVIDGDHFLLFRQPTIVAATVFEALATASPSGVTDASDTRL